MTQSTIIRNLAIASSKQQDRAQDGAHLSLITYSQGLICAGTSRIQTRHLRNPIWHLILPDPPPHAPMKDVYADLCASMKNPL